MKAALTSIAASGLIAAVVGLSGCVYPSPGGITIAPPPLPTITANTGPPVVEVESYGNPAGYYYRDNPVYVYRGRTVYYTEGRRYPYRYRSNAPYYVRNNYRYYY